MKGFPSWVGRRSRCSAHSVLAPSHCGGANINALWIVVAAVSIYLIAYRFYSLFIADKVMQLDPTRPRPR